MAGKTEIDWNYWSKLKEVKVFEALALLDNMEPGEEPPDPDETSPQYRKRLRLLLDAMSDGRHFSPGTLNIGDASQNGVQLKQVAHWALSNDIGLPQNFPRQTPAKEPPPPLKTVNTNSGPWPPRRTELPPPIDWTFWRAMVTVKLWQACALVVGMDPDRLKRHPQRWMAGPGGGPMFENRSFASAEAKDRLEKAMRLAETAVSYMDGPIFPKGKPVPGHKLEKDVSLAEVVAFFRSCEWPDIPPEIASINRSQQTSSGTTCTEQQRRELDAMRMPSLPGTANSPAKMVQRHKELQAELDEQGATAASAVQANPQSEPVPPVPSWKMLVQAEATALCRRLRKSGANPTKNSILDTMANWCRDNDVKTDGNIFPSANYLRTHVLGGKHWDLPS